MPIPDTSEGERTSAAFFPSKVPDSLRKRLPLSLTSLTPTSVRRQATERRGLGPCPPLHLHLVPPSMSIKSLSRAIFLSFSLPSPKRR